MVSLEAIRISIERSDVKKSWNCGYGARTKQQTLPRSKSKTAGRPNNGEGMERRKGEKSTAFDFKLCISIVNLMWKLFEESRKLRLPFQDLP